VAPEPADPEATDPAAGQSAAVRAAYAALRGQFLAGLPQRWQAIQSAPTPALQQAALHRLTGAAGSYGLAALGEAARRAEALCAAAAPASATETATATDTAAALRAALVAVRQALQDAGVTLR